MMSTHGPLHDEFGGRARDPHGPQHDDLGQAHKPSRGHGPLLDQFRPPSSLARYGEHWDDFGWTPMPSLHGTNYDQDFSQPAALDGTDHGSWHDVFRGGTQVRYIFNGVDTEGIVENTGADHLIVEPREGGRHEITLGQIQGFREATDQGQASEERKPAAQPGDTPAPISASTADAPSAHNQTARGGGRTSLDVTAGQDKVANKTLDQALCDVRKLADELNA